MIDILFVECELKLTFEFRVINGKSNRMIYGFVCFIKFFCLYLKNEFLFMSFLYIRVNYLICLIS